MNARDLKKCIFSLSRSQKSFECILYKKRNEKMKLYLKADKAKLNEQRQ